RRGKNPADFAEALFRVDEIGHALEHARPAVAELVLLNPVLAGETRIEDAVREVARHLLRADQHAVDFRIVDRREVRARADVDVEAGAGEQLHRRVLERPFGNPELEFHRASSFRKKHERSPVWHTLPSPCGFTFTSTVSSSQSTRMSMTARRLPDVSPFIQSLLRVRLKNVAKPVLRVRASASSFMKPTIRTSDVSASWITAGIS